MSQEDAAPRIVEAALFSAGKPLSEQEIAEATGLDLHQVAKAAKQLSHEYAQRDTALEVGRAGSKWAMQLRARYSEKARKLARMEIPGKVLKTLALIAFHQPIRQSELKEMVGSVVYDHVKELHERGMIGARQDGITKVLTTSPRFPEYFGLDATDRDGIRHVLAARVGVDPAKLARSSPQRTLGESSEAPRAAPDGETLGDGGGPDEVPADAEEASGADAESTPPAAEALNATSG